MAFEVNRWRTDVKEWWNNRTHNWKEEAQKLGVNSAYGILVAGAFLPLLPLLYQLGPEATIAALTGITSSVGGNLLSNVVQSARDKVTKETNIPPQELVNERIVQELVSQARDAEIREVLDQVVKASQSQEYASSRFQEEWEDFKNQIESDKKDLSSQKITASDSAVVIIGSKNTVNPSLKEITEFVYDMKKIFSPPSDTLSTPPSSESDDTPKRIADTQTHFSDSRTPVSIESPAGYVIDLDSNDGKLTHYKRERDGQTVILVPPHGRILKAFLIDKYQITNEQYSRFLNVLMSENLVWVKRVNGINLAIDAHEGQELIRDAADTWLNQRKYRWQYPPAPWGIQFLNGSWVPLPDTGMLPVTLVTWAGAVVYSLWANGQALFKARHQVVYLPTRQQWLAAALFDPEANQNRRFPWGPYWIRENVNYAGWWANDEVKTKQDLENKWASHQAVFELTRPLDVDTLPSGRSSFGCYQLLGNTWEWCAEVTTERGHKMSPVKGGACNSHQEHCMPEFSHMYPQNYASEYVGFRCGITIS
jgi:formylglycine-generating enzyme required for sulfatase activity